MHKPNQIDVNPEPLFPVVGIGASAGGLEAFKKFLHAIPEKSGMAYILVQHMNPNHESMLTEILSKYTKIPVKEITDNISFEPDHIYVMPAGKLLTASDGKLLLNDLNENNKNIKPIDLFFSSLAVVHQNFAVGVVLSGAATDGTLGLKVIKANGGITFAQDDSASFESMPRSAVSSGAVDFILPPEKIPGKLVEINRPFHSVENNEKIAPDVLKEEDDIYKHILTLLRIYKNVDFSYYKPTTIKRRIVRRMALNKIQQPPEYLQLLKENKNEQNALYDDMLISVTNFFRDANTFEVINDQVLPLLLKNKKEFDPFRIWIAGCATGEEAYSMAICLQEALGNKSSALKIQIFATDISEKAIAKSRSGIYSQNELEGVSPERLKQFFTKTDGSYQVNKSIREVCVFAQHNLLKDPPFAKIDMVCCRNVLIYMEPVLQKKALNIFHYALNEKGILVLGKSETVGPNSEYFIPFTKSEKIYIRKGPSGKFMHVVSAHSEKDIQKLDKKDIQYTSGAIDYQKVADQLLLTKYTPAGIIVNDQMDIVQFRGAISDYLEPSQDKASLKLMKMVKGSLAFELRNILHKVKKSNVAEKKEGLNVPILGKQHLVDIEAIPLHGTDEPYYLLLFQHKPLQDANQGNEQALQNNDNRDAYIKQLEKELAQLREDMRSVTEEQEAANEELQSANEELLSGSEELQSLNEELETSQEELQSSNEEMQIINQELIDRNDQLIAARNYSDAIIETVRDPLLILDRSLVIKSATNGFYEKFKMNEKETEGKLLFELGNGQWNIPALRHLLEKMIPQKTSFSDYELRYSFPFIGQRDLLLNARRIERVNNEQYVLLAIEDVTEKKIIEKGLEEVKSLFQQSQERLKLAVDATGIGTWDHDPATGNWIMDDRCLRLYNMPLDQEVIGYETFIATVHKDDKAAVNDAIQQALNGVNNGDHDIEFRSAGIENEPSKWIRAKGKVFFKEGRPYRFIGTSLDITKQKQIQDELERLVKERTQSLDEAITDLERSNQNLEQFAYVASHDLQEPLRKINTFADRIIEKDQETLSEAAKDYFRRMQNAAKRMQTLIDDLLAYSRINRGERRFENTSLKKIIDEVKGDLKEEIEQKKAVIETGEMCDAHIIAFQFKQLMENLIANSLKFSKPDIPPHIIIKSETKNSSELDRADLLPDKRYCHISVADNGIGFEPEYSQLIFEVFQRLHGRQQYEGTGIGLAIVKKIVENHKGIITATSELDKGATFDIYVPE